MVGGLVMALVMAIAAIFDSDAKYPDMDFLSSQ